MIDEIDECSSIAILNRSSMSFIGCDRTSFASLSLSLFVSLFVSLNSITNDLDRCSFVMVMMAIMMMQRTAS